MAREKTSRRTKAEPTIDLKKISEIVAKADNMISDMELSMYGTTAKTDSDDITTSFNSIMKNQIDLLNRQNGEGVTSFIEKLFKNDLINSKYSGRFDSFMSSEASGMMSYMAEEYQTKLAKYSDLKEVTSQLIELNEAILIMRDSIVSPDVSEGTVALDIDIDNDGNNSSAISIIKQMEEKFNIREMIKKYVVPNTLRFGTYYAYLLPYKDLFAKFDKAKQLDPKYNITTASMYRESTLYDSLEGRSSSELSEYITESSSVMMSEIETRMNPFELGKLSPDDRHTIGKEMNSGMSDILKRITVCNESCPIPFLEEGAAGIQALYEYTESNSGGGTFSRVHNIDNGVYDASSKVAKKSETKFSDISDCYVKFIDPIHLRPIKIMKKVIGYCYIQETEDAQIGGFFGTTYKNLYGMNNDNDRSMVNRLASKVVQAFDKKFLDDNIELKEFIAESLMHFDLTRNKVRFQYIPAEYIIPFTINEDEAGDGVSIVEPSLFYAKLYLMLLLFKITSIILYSNDTKVNYVRTSGIDKDLANKIGEIARDKQRHTINMKDLMSYSSLIKKMSRGTEQYIPLGRGGERGLETEILQGQDVQLNSDLMELLRTCYILGTGVPSAIMNYLNEADFAKSIEVANSRFLGRVMSLQLDFNPKITEFYKKLAQYSTTLDNDVINNITVTLRAPKSTNNGIKQEAVGGFETLKEFLMKLFYGDDYQSAEGNDRLVQQEFVKFLVDKYLPFVDIDELQKKVDELKITLVEKKLDPSTKDTSSIDEIDTMMGEIN